MGRRANTVADFWAKVDKTSDPRGCWLWQGTVNSKGYGQIRIASKAHRTHRLAYRLVVGDIPDGLCLDHLCRVRHCCNPDHLEPVTNRENILRGIGPSAINAATTRCVEGHEFSPGNTHIVPTTGERRCKICARRRNRELVAQRRVAIAADPSLTEHGTPSTYTGWGCRCIACKAAWSEYMHAYNVRRKARRAQARQPRAA